MWTTELNLRRLADLLDGLGIGLCAFDAEDRALGWNRTFLDFFPEHDGHVRVGEPYRDNLFRFYGTRLSPDEMPHIAEHVARGIARHQAQNRPFQFEHRGVELRVSVQTIPCLGRVRVWKNVGAAPRGADHPIALGDKPAGWGDTAPDGIAHIDAGGLITATNREFERLYGLAPDDAAGQTLEEVVTRAWQVARDAHQGHFERHVLPHLREALRFEGAAFEIPLPEDRWIRVIGGARSGPGRTSVHFDITPLKREQAALRAAESEARRQASHLRTMIECAPGGIVVLGPTGVVLETNRAFRDALGGYLPEGLTGRPLASLMLPAEGDTFERLLTAVEATAVPAEGELRFLRRDGRTMWARASLASLPHQGEQANVLLQVEDVTARRIAEFALREKTDLLDATLEAMDQGLVMTDAGDNVRVFNRRAVELLDLPDGLLRDGAPYAAVRAIQMGRGEFATLPGDVRRWLEGDALDDLVPCYERERADGRVLEVRTTPLSQGGVVRVLRDVTERRAAEMRVAHMACHDALTGLRNRGSFRDGLKRRLDQPSRHGGSCAVLCLDLDRFKPVNDTLGHAAGDALLCEVARRIERVLRAGDVVARLGGDEFAVLLDEGSEPDMAASAAERLVRALSDPVLLDGRLVNVGVSIGVALAPRHGEDVDQLMARADVALYRAKAEGRSTFRIYDPAMDEIEAGRRRIELDLRSAVRRGDFVLHYQPIFAIDDRRVVSYEALVRWQHPTLGLIPPSDFIALAEETGLIAPLGAWVLHTACRDASRWAGTAGVAVNVSASQIQGGSVVQMVRSALSGSGLAPERLEVEITESALMNADAAPRETLHALRALGVRIALDDFGTGYSSLSYLRHFPFDKIKIDRSFIADIADPNTAAIVRAVVDIGRRLGATITAEGIETERQLELARAEGCQEAQGYFLGRPEPLRRPQKSSGMTNA